MKKVLYIIIAIAVVFFLIGLFKTAISLAITAGIGYVAYRLFK